MAENNHKPVLLDEVIASFMEQPHGPTRILDGTFGRGGHTSALLKKMPRVEVVAFDKDQDAVKFAESNTIKTWGKRLKIIHDDFKNMESYNLGFFDGVLLDLGVSSPQFDEAERGFSFMHDGPLDMRMNKNQKENAADIINNYSEKELSDLFYQLGEVRKPNRVVRAIVHDRKTAPFTTTRQLAGLIERVDGRKRGHKLKQTHPATGYFMALRIAVNGELEGLDRFLENMPLHMEPGGRICVISFHSLEDRIVKTVFKKLNKKFGTIINKKVITATDEELKENPRARSAKLRIFETGGAL